MNPNVLIGVTVVFVLLVAACGLWMNTASKTVEKTIDHSWELICYDYGYRDGAHGAPKGAPYTDKRCVEAYTDAYDDGIAGNYDAPRAD